MRLFMKLIIVIFGVMITLGGFSDCLWGSKKTVKAPTLSLQQKKAILKKFPISLHKISEASGVAAVRVKGKRYLWAVAMGDGSGPMDYARVGVTSRFSVGSGFTGSVDGKFKVKFIISKVQGTVTLWLNIDRDGNVPMMMTPKKLVVKHAGAYVLEANKAFKLEPNHVYNANAYVELSQPGAGQVSAVVGQISATQWIY